MAVPLETGLGNLENKRKQKKYLSGDIIIKNVSGSQKGTLLNASHILFLIPS